MEEPVLGSDGHTYEQTTVKNWRQKSDISPLEGNGVTLTDHFIPNKTLKKIINRFVEEKTGSIQIVDFHFESCKLS